MEILTFLEGKKLTVAPNGRLDSSTTAEFEKVLNENINQEIEELIIDCSKVDFISSKGLRALVITYKIMSGRTMVILNPNTSVKEVLGLSGLLKVFTIK